MARLPADDAVGAGPTLATQPDEGIRWRLVMEFLEELGHEAPVTRLRRVWALSSAPAAFRRRGIFLEAEDLERA